MSEGGRAIVSHVSTIITILTSYYTIDVDSHGEVNHICLLLGHASMQQVEEVIHICLLFRSRIYAAGWRGDSHLFTFLGNASMQQVEKLRQMCITESL